MANTEQISKWEELGWDSKEEYDKHLLQSGEIAENDTPQMAKERILSNFKIQFQQKKSRCARSVLHTHLYCSYFYHGPGIFYL